MTTIVYKEEMITSKSPTSGTPRNVQTTKTFTVHIGDTPQGRGSSSKTHGQRERHSRGGSPRPAKTFAVRSSKSGKSPSYSSQYNPHVFTITAYLPHEGGRRLKLQCIPGQSVQQVIESADIPNLAQSGYQVYQFPSRALLNPEKDASVLQDQEISIEPMRANSPVQVDDDRLAVAKELLRSEDIYLENLRNIFDIYMEPLKKWGLPQSDMNIMFRSLSRLCDVLMNFFSELELGVMHWSPNSTPIGGLFKQYRSFWEMYSEYNKSYAKACKLLKDKRAMDESFNKFLEMKRGAAMHTLESLMLLPVQRIYEYHKLLMRLYSLTPKEHPDYYDLRHTITCVGSMVRDREHQLNQNQNEVKLEQVQIRFPNDNLHLFQPLDLMETRMSARRSRTYHSGSGGAGTPSRHMRSAHQNWMSTPALGTAITSQDNVDAGKMKARLYISEGPVRIYSGMQSHDRHLFLFDDLLIISKPIKQKSQQKIFKRKGQLRLSEVWVTECMDKSLESVLVPDTYFVIGWPFTNCVAAFSTPEEKSLWFNWLTKYILAQRQKADPEKVTVQILNCTISSSSPTPTLISVHAQEEARALLVRAIEILAIAVSEGNCQIWAKISKDDSVLLAGHEYPYAIQMYHNRHKLDYSDKPSQLQFIVKRKETAPSVAPRAHRLSGISLPWKKSRPRRESASRRVFGAPLDRVIVNNELPELLQEILVRLFTEAPTSRGIFRRSANYKRVNGFINAIDNGVRLKLAECTIDEVGALLKNLLRSVPGGILLSILYTEFVATNDFKDIPTRVQQIHKVVTKLPNENQLFLSYLMPLLHHISKNHETNGMNSINLAICFAPSLLWPSSGLDVIKNEVPPLIQFMIEHCPDIFGAELPVLYKQAVLPPSPGVEKMEFSVSTPATKQFVPTKVDDGNFPPHGHKRSDSVGSSMSEGSTTADDHTNSLLKARQTGLTVSDSQLSQISQLEEYEGAGNGRIHVGKRGKIETSGRHIHSSEVGGGGGILQPSMDQPSAKRVKKTRVPERSSSLHGPNDMSYNRPKYVRRPADPSVRRKSIAVQEAIRREFAASDFPPSPNSSYSSSSHSYSPKMMKRIHHSQHQHYSGQYGRHEESPTGHSVKGQKKNRKLPQHSHSFTSKDMEKPRLIPSSSSFYDKLLPLDADGNAPASGLGSSGGRGRNEHRTFTAQLTLLDPGEDTHHARPILTSSTTTTTSQAPSSSFPTSSSTHSISGSSSISSQTRPSNLSITTGGSGGSLDVPTPDLLLHNKGEFIKVAISERFKLNSAGGIDYPHPSGMTPSTGYPQDRILVDDTPPSRESFASPESGQDSLERIQRKFHERKRLDSTGSESAFSKSSSYKGFLSQQHTKDSLMSLTEESSFDDRPECDFHLATLQRQRAALNAGGASTESSRAVGGGAAGGSGVFPDTDSNRLYTGGNGYNSDTESAPSRTLNRPGKIMEVSSPVKTNLPSRYYMKTPSSHAQHQQGESVGKVTLSSPRQQTKTLSQQPQKTVTTQQQHQLDTTLHQRKVELTSSLGSTNVRGVDTAATPAIPLIAEPLVTTSRTITKTSSNGARRRPKSGNGDRVEKLTEVYREKESEQVNANIEDAKVRLGLIPPATGSAAYRQRSKSTSEHEAMKILHRMPELSGDVGTEHEQTLGAGGAAAAVDEVEWVSKHKEWLSSAPTPAERKEARENYSQFQRMEYNSSSMRDQALDKPTAGSAEVRQKSSTLPDIISPLGRHCKTVKVRTYEIPGAQKIRRINLRTYH